MQMKVVVFDTQPAQADLDVQYMSRDEVLAHADIVSCHVPGGAGTKGMINKDFLAKMKPDGVLLNTSRGTIAVDEDLLAHLEANPNFWYGADVYNNEPSGKEAEWKSELASHPRVYGTHHCGASTKQAENAIGEEALRVITKFSESGEVDVENFVNRARPDPSMQKMSIRLSLETDALMHVMKVF